MNSPKETECASRIRLVCSDFDGVFTDAMVYTDQNGVESVRCSRRDSLGINMLKRVGISVHVISKETNPVVATRCKKMGIEYDQAVDSGEGKAEIMKRVALNAGLDLSQVAFIGDDINDVPALKIAGLAVTVADGHYLAKEIAHYTTKARGGEHAIRELCEYILTAQGHTIAY
ncbi:MAG: HAD hydrolase family protein [Parcubacteria group bacterium]|nr:HAD hydrolase family protein [Parcubacteria group bacterium]